MGHGVLLETGRMTIQLNVRDCEHLSGLFPDPALPFKGYHYLWQRGLSLAGPDPLRNEEQQLVSTYRAAPRNACMARIDSEPVITGMEAAPGWTWDRERTENQRGACLRIELGSSWTRALLDCRTDTGCESRAARSGC
jgi:hypothetical protein